MNRFEHPSKKNLININKNLYINPSDPFYNEKIGEYIDPHSGEAHFKLGEKNEEKGFIPTALYHYREAARLHSPYNLKAKKAVTLIEDRINSSFYESEIVSTPTNDPAKSYSPFLLKSLISFLLLLNSALFILIYVLSQ